MHKHSIRTYIFCLTFTGDTFYQREIDKILHSRNWISLLEPFMHKMSVSVIVLFDFISFSVSFFCLSFPFIYSNLIHKRWWIIQTREFSKCIGVAITLLNLSLIKCKTLVDPLDWLSIRRQIIRRRSRVALLDLCNLWTLCCWLVKILYFVWEFIVSRRFVKLI